jgi:hypothetical protein
MTRTKRQVVRLTGVRPHKSAARRRAKQRHVHVWEVLRLWCAGCHRTAEQIVDEERRR